MEANKWKPGQSGNPTGRPKKRQLTECYEALSELLAKGRILQSHFSDVTGPDEEANQ